MYPNSFGQQQEHGDLYPPGEPLGTSLKFKRLDREGFGWHPINSSNQCLNGH